MHSILGHPSRFLFKISYPSFPESHIVAYLKSEPQLSVVRLIWNVHLTTTTNNNIHIFKCKDNDVDDLIIIYYCYGYVNIHHNILIKLV